jgi:predicted HNH restriction endonuclease
MSVVRIVSCETPSTICNFTKRSCNKCHVQRSYRTEAIKLYALKRANGICGGCDSPAPFITLEGRSFLEVHHIRQVSDGGPDHPEWVIAVCPNYHRKAHYAVDKKEFNELLKEKVRKQELAV